MTPYLERINEVYTPYFLQYDEMGCYAATMACALTGVGLRAPGRKSYMTLEVDAHTNIYGEDAAGQSQRQFAIDALACELNPLGLLKVFGGGQQWHDQYLRSDPPCTLDQYLAYIRQSGGEELYEAYRQGLSEELYQTIRSAELALYQKCGGQITRHYLEGPLTCSEVQTGLESGPVIVDTYGSQAYMTHSVTVLDISGTEVTYHNPTKENLLTADVNEFNALMVPDGVLTVVRAA